MPQLEPTRCQLTLLGFHSVAKDDQSRSTFAELHAGQVGTGAVEAARYSSNCCSQSPQRYS